MKRSILALVLALATVFALAACGRGDKAAAPVQPTADTAKKAEDITLCPTYDDGKGGYFSVTLPASWGDHYLTECGANDGGYYVGFYEKTDHDNGLCVLFGVELAKCHFLACAVDTVLNIPSYLLFQFSK